MKGGRDSMWEDCMRKATGRHFSLVWVAGEGMKCLTLNSFKKTLHLVLLDNGDTACDANTQGEPLIVSQSHFQLEECADYFPLTPKFSKHLELLRKLNDKSNISTTMTLMFGGEHWHSPKGKKTLPAFWTHRS